MNALFEDMKEYQTQLKKGHIQRAYKGIMKFMASLRSYLAENHPDHGTGALYFGYMDMTYFSFTPKDLKAKKLKVAIVYLHVENRFECWLSAVNKNIQKEVAKVLRLEDTGEYKVSLTTKGVDSIIEKILVSDPKFSDQDNLMEEIEKKVLHFIDDMEKITVKMQY